MINYKKLLEDGYEYVVVAAYDSPYGRQGTLISRHKNYENAEKSITRRFGRGETRNWLAIRDVRSYA